MIDGYYRFGEFRLHIRARELRDSRGLLVGLSAKAFDTLAYLVEHRDRVVSKNELLSAIWPGRVVEENNLNQAISALRRAMECDSSERRFIITIPGRGYRFIMDAAEELETELLMAPAMPVVAPTSYRPWTRWYFLLPLLVLVLAASFTIHFFTIGSFSPQVSDKPSLSTLVVLPFRFLDGEKSDPLLEFGLPDTLIVRLARQKKLNVRSLESARVAIDPQMTQTDIGRRLKADILVDGSIQRINEEVRINVRLWNLPESKLLWTDTYVDSVSKMFDLQDQISKEILAALGLKEEKIVSQGERPCGADNIEAYRELLIGRYLVSRAEAGRLSDTLDAYRKAIDLDPTCAPAYAGMARVYRAMTITGNSDPRKFMPLALAAANKAIEIDPQLADAYVQLGFVKLWYDRDWDAAEAAFARALELDPNLAYAQFGYANLMMVLNRVDEALHHSNRAKQLDPLSPLIASLDAAVQAAAGQLQSALVSLQHVSEIAPDYWLSFYIHGGLMLDQGDAQSAVADLEHAAEHSNDNTQVLGLLVMAYVAAGNQEAAHSVLRRLESDLSHGHVSAAALAAAYLGVGDVDRALDFIERADQERDSRISFLGIDARWKSLRNHPRFQKQMHKLGLTQGEVHGRF